MVVAILVVLLSVLVVVLSRARQTATSAACIGNLRAIGMGFRQYALEADGYLPNPIRYDTTWEASIVGYLGSRDVFICPADAELGPVLGSSYDWRDTGDSRTTAAGKSPEILRQDAVLAFDSLPGWHAQGKMNAVTVSIAASAMTVEDCLGDLFEPSAR